MHSSPGVLNVGVGGPKGVRPVPKKGFRAEKTGSPFPNFLLGEHEVPSVCRCVFDGDNFYVLNSKDMHILNHNGSFGVSSLTHRGPSDDEPSFYLKPYFTKKLELDRDNSSVRLVPGSTKESFFTLIEAEELPLSKNGLERNNGHCKSNIFRKSSLRQGNAKGSSTTNGHERFRSGGGDVESSESEDGFEVEGDTHSPKCDLFLHNLRCNIEEERLILMPEEAIFLSFGVGCLTIHNQSGGSVGYRKVWRRLVESNPEFPITYAVYHYFRSKNWVPKLGDSYGASYLLYKIGPSAYHASYLVHILGFPSRPSPTWNELNSWVRLGCHVSKNVLLCEVSVPRRFDAGASEPMSIFDMSLKETSLFRWKANSGTLIKF